MSQDLAWLNNYRYNYGSNNGLIWYPDDSYNRIWNPKSVPGSVNTTAEPGTSLYFHSDESPPDSAILDAIEAPNGTSLFLSFNPVQPMTAIYIEAYFTEMQSDLPGMRSFDIYAEDVSLGVTVKPEYSTCTAASHLVQTMNDSLTIELRPTATSLLPPIISAIEIYTASDPLVTSGTDENDLKGLAAFTSTFDQLKGWSGEPCLPADTAWQWLGCSGTDHPRVTSLNLTGYNLNGALPDFSQMQALEDIDLSKNRLSGQIPEFLGQLSNLKKLNLSYNDFTGTLPSSVCQNTKLTYNVIGNRIDDPPCKPTPPPPPPGGGNSKPSAVGPAIGTTVVVVLIIVGVVYWLIRRRRRQDNNHTTGTENGMVQDSFMTNASTANLLRPQPSPVAHAPNRPTAEEDDDDDCIPVSMLASKPNNNQSMAPVIDLDELEELIDQYANGVNHISNHADLKPDAPTGENGSTANNDQSMAPDLDFEELDQIIKHEKEKANGVA